MRVLCFGDSNTYGYDPRSFFGNRYPADARWVDLLAEKSGWKVFNAGENGREIPRTAVRIGWFQETLSQFQPLDLLVLMLGTNDLLTGAEVDTVVSRMEAFLRQIPLEGEKILLIAAPILKLGAWVPEAELVTKAEALSKAYGKLAQKMGVRFADAGSWGVELAFDGAHFSEAGHKTFASRLYEVLK